jgi:5-methylcytosine-specific restriction endonuclease McrA
MADDWTRLSGQQRRRWTDAVLVRFGWTCCICSLPIKHRRDATAQHVLPRSKGGLTTMANLRPAHARCNYSVKDRILTGPAAVVVNGKVWFNES